MADRYYEAEHFAAYARLRREGLSQWNDLHADDQSTPYEDFQSRGFLDRVLPTGDRARDRRVLEYGCGTGAAACFLAQRGFDVDAVDLVPDAITVAQSFAEERGVVVRFAVQDICDWPDTGDRFDYVIDNFCLQSIVTDADRAKVLASVRARLLPAGQYLISTAMHEPGRDYGDDHYNPNTGIVWVPQPHRVADSAWIEGSWHVPNRRHHTPEALRRELESHGFNVIEQSGPFGGEIVCGAAQSA